jgi:hypothetical protein
MAHLKGMDTWMWLAGGIIIAILAFVMFLQIFSSLMAQSHAQASQESMQKLVADANAMCSMISGQSSYKTYRFSTIVDGVFAASNTTYNTLGERSYGDKACINISGRVSCEKVKCTIEIEPFMTNSKITGFLEKLTESIRTTDYRMNLMRTECGVSIIAKGSKPSCYCGTDDLDMPIYYDYNGIQPILLRKDNSLVLANTYLWIKPNSNTKQLLKNAAGYLGGRKILIVYEDNLTSPKAAKLYSILMEIGKDGSTSADATGMLFYIKPHDQNLNFDGYDQIWLVTPGFCETNPQNCINFKSWSKNEILGIINASKTGVGIFIITDSGAKNGVAPSLNLDMINSLLLELNYPVRQINSCLGDCMGNSTYNASLDTKDVLTSSLEGYEIKSAASFDLECGYAKGYSTHVSGPHTLVSLNQSPVVLLFNRTLILLDTTPFINTGNYDPNSLRFLSNVVNHFGDKVLVVWEDSCIWNTSMSSQGLFCPLTSSVNPENSEAISYLNGKGASVDSFRHDTPLTPQIMKGYNQVWLFRPGWCGYKSNNFVRSYQQYCSPFIGWNETELQAVADYVSSGGNLTIFLDYSPYLPKPTIDELFYRLGLDLELKEGARLGKFTFELSNSPLLEGVEKYPIKAVAILVKQSDQTEVR